MIIGIDGNEANVHKRVGISEVAYWILYYFAEFAESEKEKNRKFITYLKDKPLDLLPSETDNWHYKVFGPKKFWTQFGLPLRLRFAKPRPNVFLSLTHYAPRFSPIPTVISIMDLSYLYYPQTFKKRDLYQLKSWTAYSAKKAKKIITISNSSKNDIIKEYKIPEEKVAVVYPGIKETISLEPHVYGMNELEAKYHLSSHFVLFVGTLQPRKNITKLIESFAKVVKDNKMHKDLQLVIVGKKGWLYEEILAAPEKFNVTEKVKFLDAIPDDELVILYQHALCYVLPSLYEGFGLPVLEAMKYGCPVITSNISSLPEAGGDAAVYVNPNDEQDIAEKIVKVLSDEKLRHEMKEKGKKQVAKFSWEKTARETLKILEEVAKG
jgi:glycosyltransferase involved in cell wall biosynthesis